MKKACLILFIFLIHLNLRAQKTKSVLPLIPQPVQLTTGKQAFRFQEDTRIVCPSKALQSEAAYLAAYMQANYNINLKIVTHKPKKQTFIEFKLQSQNDTSEKYKLKSDAHKISIVANSSTGIFYGIQTIIQLLPQSSGAKAELPALNITDYPRYSWRGMHLDCSRHFYNAAFVKKYIDLLASYKMNVFHWHLTDDQGWRIEIKNYPKLTQIGAWRKGSMIGPYADHKFDSIPYGGFYTQDEIKEIVAYAQTRHVTIVPEIEMPGHALAALAAYPEYSCTGNPAEVGMQWGVETNIFCPYEKTFAFLDTILSEVVDLFPGKYIHIGGDEVLKDEWNKSPFCQILIQSRNMKDAHELQSYFIQRIELILNNKGRSIIGWDEILEGGLAPKAAVMSWRGTDGGIAAAKQKHYVVMTPGTHCYFDHYQGKPESEPLAIGGFTPLEKVYAYEPTPDTLTADEATYIMGAQGNVWSEYMYTSSQVEYMAVPRMAALAEVVWSKKEKRNYTDFYNRMLAHLPFLDKKGVNYSKTAFIKKD